MRSVLWERKEEKDKLTDVRTPQLILYGLGDILK
jgi:hypothetical protein